MDIDKMQAGRKMDAKIARLLGYGYSEGSDRDGNDFYHIHWKGRSWDLPNYSTDIEAAWELLDKMIELGWLPTIEYAPGCANRWWECYLGHMEVDAIIGEARTVPLAISRAALKVMQDE